MQIRLGFAQENAKLRNWPAAHVRGEVPDALPYGLDALASPADVLTVEALTATNKTRALVDAASPCRMPVGSGARVTWDEYTFARLLPRWERDARCYTGVIWATDLWVRGSRRLSTALVRRSLLGASGLWCLSRAQLPVVADWLGGDAPPTHFVRFGIDTSFFSAWRMPAGPPTIVSAGTDERDLATLLEALSIVIRENPDVRAVVQNHTPPAVVPAGVQFRERLTHLELRDLYRQATVVAVATRNNLHVSGMTVALEAQATGRPVVLTETPGMRDYVEDGVTGRLVVAQRPDQLASELLRLLGDPHTIAVMGKAARERVERLHSSRQTAQRIRSLIASSSAP